MQNKKIITILQGSLAWVFVVLVIGAIGTWYLFRFVDKAEQSLEVARDDYQTTLGQLESFDEIKSNFESTKGIKNDAESMLVGADNTLSLIEELEKAAEISGVTLKTSVGVKPGTTKQIVPKLGQFPQTGLENKNKNTNASDQEVWLELTVEGNFSGILKFVRYLENARKLVAVSSININQGSTMLAADVLENSEGTLGNLKSVILVTNVF